MDNQGKMPILKTNRLVKWKKNTKPKPNKRVRRDNSKKTRGCIDPRVSAFGKCQPSKGQPGNRQRKQYDKASEQKQEQRTQDVHLRLHLPPHAAFAVILVKKT